MEEYENKEKVNNKVTKEQTFSVPFTFGEIIENITISTNRASKSSKQQIINQALKYHSQGNIQEAIKYYHYFINQGFKDHRIFSNYGIILKNQGNLEEAEISIRKAIELKPDFADAHLNFGNVLMALGSGEKAEISIRKAIELKPDYADAYFNLGIILKDIGKIKEAEISIRKAIELKPDYADAHYSLGLILCDLGYFQEAELEKEKGINMNFIKNIDSGYRSDCLQYLNLSKSQYKQDLFALSELKFKKNGFFVEFGSFDGLINSNSYLLEKIFKWNGILAEPSIYCHEKLKENRSVIIETKCVWKSSDQDIIFNEPFSYKQMATIDSFSNNDEKFYQEGKRYKVKTISLLDLLNINNAPKFIDYLSIDTEGSEYEILNAFDFEKYKFRVITCEHNFTPMREKIYKLLINKGYKRKLTNISKVDDWYVLAE